MGILVVLPEIIIEVAEVAAEAAAAAAEAAAEAAAAAAEAAIDSAIDAGVEGAVSGLVDGGMYPQSPSAYVELMAGTGIDSALDSALDAAIDGISEQIARTAGGQAIKKLVDKVGQGAAKRVINLIKDKVKDKLKDEAKQDLKDYISGKLQPPPPPTDVAVPAVPDGVNIDKLTIDVNGGQYVQAENYFKAVHGAFLQARQNENVPQMITFSSSAAHALAGMANARQTNAVVFRLLDFDGDLGTSKWVEALAVYNKMITSFTANTTNEEANAIVDPIKDDLQNKINDALANTYVPPAITMPDRSKYTDLANNNKYPLKDPADYATIEDTLKSVNTSLRAAFNVSNKTSLIECVQFMSELTRDGVELRKACQPALAAVEADAAGATADWNTINTFWSHVQQTLTFQSNHDDLNNLLLKATPSMDSINATQTAMYLKTAKATPQQIQQRQQQQQQQQQKQRPQFGTPGQPGAPQQPGAPRQPGAPQQPGAPRQPGAPQQPGAPRQPGAPQQPGAPRQPGAPQQPGAPRQPGAPQQPGAPRQPGAPQQPGAPRQPGAPQQPGAPRQPGAPQQPGAPRQPGGPQQPGAPQNILAQKQPPGSQAKSQSQQQTQQALARQQPPPGAPPPGGARPRGAPPPTPPSTTPSSTAANGAPLYDPIHSVAHQAISYGATAAAPYIANAAAPHVANAVKNAAPELARQGVGYALDGFYGSSAPTPVSGFPDAPAVNGANGAPAVLGAGKGRGQTALRGGAGKGPWQVRR